MNLFILESKRVLKTKRTFIILIIIMLLSAITAYIPITFESIAYIDNNGNTVTLKGIEAIEYKKEVQAGFNGDVTPEKINLALQTYKNVVREYGDPDGLDFPGDIYIKDILPIRPLLNLLNRTYNNEIMNIDSNDLDQFYEINKDLLNDKISSIDPYESSKIEAENMYNSVEKPFK